MSNERILIVEEDGAAAAHLQACLETRGYEVCGAVSAMAGGVCIARLHSPGGVQTRRLLHLR